MLTLPGPRHAALACLLLAACETWTPSTNGGTGGTSNNTSGGGTAIFFGSGGGTFFGNATGGGSSCRAGLGGAPEQSSLADQAIPFERATSKVFYTWTSQSSESALRAGEDLLSTGEDPELGRGKAMELLHLAAQSESATETTKALAAVYQKYRYAWPNPWATRMGWPGESYGDRLVRIELKSEAWIAVLDQQGSISEVYNLYGNVVTLEELVGNEARVGAIYFRNAVSSCGEGSFSIAGSGGYREFILGSPSMIESFSIGTTAIKKRVASDIAALEDYLLELRTYGAGLVSTGAFDRDFFCELGATCDPYLLSLAIGSEFYQPTATNILAILDTLRAWDSTVAPYERNGN